MKDDKNTTLIGFGVVAAIIFLLYGCGDESPYYCVQWEAQGGCLVYESD